MLGDDAVVQALVEFWAAVDGDGAAAGEGDGLHQICVGGTHLMDFSKGFGSDVGGNEDWMNRHGREVAEVGRRDLLAGSVPWVGDFVADGVEMAVLTFYRVERSAGVESAV